MGVGEPEYIGLVVPSVPEPVPATLTPPAAGLGAVGLTRRRR